MKYVILNHHLIRKKVSMTRIKQISLFILTLATTFTATSQLSVTGEVRPRSEAYSGNNTRLRNSGEAIGVATQQRTRLYFDYKGEEGVRLVFSPQVIHFWGQMPQAYDLLGDGTQGGNEGTFSVFEAYAEYKASDLYTLKVGRQAISYGDQRWFGALGWAATGRAHDAFVNKFTFGDVKLDVGAALSSTKHIQGVDSTAIASVRAGYKSMQFFWLTIPSGDFKIQAMATNVTGVETLTATDVTYANTATFGILPSYSNGDLAINASYYIQSGKNRSSSLLAADLTYKGLGFPVTLGADIVSGDDINSGDSETWLQPFGTNHKFYGFMDFFYVGETPSFGLNDFYIKSVGKTGEKSKIIGFVHLLSTNQDFTSPTDGAVVGGSLGTEIDLIYDLNVAKGFNFKLGYSTIFANELFEEYKSGSADEFNMWAWMQLTFKPKFM